MAPRNVTTAPQVSPIVTGRFRESPSYATWRPHGTNDYLLILTVGGGGRFGHGGGDIITSPGDVVILRPGTPHDYATARGVSGWEIVWAHFLPRPDWLEWLAILPQAAPGIARLALGDNTEERRTVESTLKTMNDYANGGRARATDFAMNALESALLHADAANPEATARGKFDERVLRVMDRLRGANLAKTASIADLAATVNLSESRLSHLFKAQTGTTPIQFQEAERIARARQLLTLTNRSVAAIAEEIGFASPFYFSLRFKKYTGQNPRDFRNATHGR